MSSNPKETGPDYASMLLDLESQLRHSMNDASLRQDVFMAIRRLLQQSSNGERDVRQLITERFNTGQMRKETLLVVQKMLESLVAESASPEPDGADTVVIAPHTGVADSIAANESVAFEQPLPGTVLRDRYLLKTKVAGGSMGVVFKALDRRLAEVESDEPWVAIKVLTPKLSRSAEALRAMQQEAAKGRCLTHANIVRFIDLDREGDTYFIVMEWIEGRSLAEILDDPNSKNLGPSQIVAIAQQLGDALEYAHRCGVVHADVKPANVMMKTDGQVKLIDFGIARVRQQHRMKPGAFDPKVLGAGTAAYSSMQVLTDDDPAPADDVFSLACLIYRMIAGYRVFGPRNAREAAEEGMSPQQPNGMPDGPWKVLKKALSFARVARYSSPSEFVSDLSEAYNDARQKSVAAPSLELDSSGESGGRLPWIAAAVLVLGLGTIAVWQSGLLNSDGPSSTAASSSVGRTDPGPARATYAQSDLDVADDESVAGLANRAVSDRDAAGEETADGELDVSDLLSPAGISNEAVSDEGSAIAVEANDAFGTSAVDASAVPAPLPDESLNYEALSESTVQPAAGTSADPLEVAAIAELNPAPGRIADESPASASTIEAPTIKPEAPPETPIGVATHRLSLAATQGSTDAPLDVTIRENGPPAIIELVRGDAVGDLDLIVEEVSFSGNRNELATRQYYLSNEGWVRFAPGQDRSQVGIYMTPDPAREADLQAELVVRNASNGDVLGTMNIVLEDDDQRAFEARIAPNTVGFAASQVSVSEDQTAAQIDVVRYRPDFSPLEIAFMVQDVTATQSADYFAPASETVSFGPNERSARILVPLVQDTEVEGDEAFFIELIAPTAGQDREIFRRIAVMIRDDDS